MKEGKYNLQVHQFSKRSTTDVGFNIEVEFAGEVYNFSYDKLVTSKQYVNVCDIYYSRKDGFKVVGYLQSSSKVNSKEIWGLDTNKFHKVKSIMHSPNFWDDKTIGNKHTFFMLEGAKNAGVVRGFFNEFLKPELEAHKRVFEALGSKMAVEPSDNQLSGLGFSSTTENNFIVRVTGKFTRTLKVTV